MTRVRKLVMMGLVLGGAGVTLAATSTVDEPMCVVAARWAEENAKALPSSLTEFSTYSLPYRKAIYHRLSRAEKLNLWHEQVRYYLDSLTLTDAQRAFIVKTDQEMEQYFGPERREERIQQQYVSRGKEILGTAIAKMVFADLGINTPEARAVAKGDVVAGGCSCNRSGGGDFCPTTGLACGQGSCIITADGCGWWWCEPCDGDCNGNG